jgi:hypothetical protein
VILKCTQLVELSHEQIHLSSTVPKISSYSSHIAFISDIHLEIEYNSMILKPYDICRTFNY